jgi:polyketide cyclase/dehydrase/lipid transport protein
MTPRTVIAAAAVVLASLTALAQQPAVPAASPGAQATPPAPAGGRGQAPLLVPNPTYASVHVTVAVNGPVDKVWARVGKYCDIGEWGGFGGCTIVSGTDGEVGVVRSIGSEIMVAKTQYSYTYTQPVRTSGFYNMYHGTVEARALTPTTTELHYTLFFDNSNLADAAARETDMNNRRTRATGWLQNMKILAEGGTLPARGRGGLN